MRPTGIWMIFVCAVISVCLSVVGGARAQSEFQTEEWNETRKTLFGDRPIREGTDGVFQFEVPARPEDGGAVPISIKAAAPQSAERFVKRIVVVIDKNPEPLAAVFHLTPESGLAQIDTHMRVETHSPMRAIVEMNDGTLLMSAKFIKAAGGCSALPVLDADAAAAAARMGQIQIRTPNDILRNEPSWAQFSVNHPNYTGFQKHPTKLTPISAHYVTNVVVTFAGKPILTAETTIASSENPSFRFHFTPPAPGALKVEVKDSRGQSFARSVDVALK